MNTFKSSAITTLTQQQKPLHYAEITRLALESGILQTEGATPEATMNAQITVDIKTKGEASDFIRTAPGTFALNQNKKETPPPQKAIKSDKQQEEKLQIESGFTGKAGEHLVCSELLFRGFNASIMSVDVGVDISAIKDNSFYGIQVKTANINKFNTYNFHIRRVSFERHNQGNIFYIFVLRDRISSQFLILPCAEIERKIAESAIFAVNKESGYSVNLKIRDGQIFLGNKDHAMNYFLNNWGLIK